MTTGNGNVLTTPEGQKWTRWLVGIVIAVVVAWFGIEARVQILEARIIRLEHQVDRMDNKIDKLLYRSLYSTLTPLPEPRGGG
jgi:hypothetical protein